MQRANDARARAHTHTHCSFYTLSPPAPVVLTALQLAILRNGQARLRIGDLLFDVTSALPR